MCWARFLILFGSMFGISLSYKQNSIEYLMVSDYSTPAIMLVDREGKAKSDLRTPAFTHCLYFYIMHKPKHREYTLVSYASRDAKEKDEIVVFVKPKSSETFIRIHEVLTTIKTPDNGPKDSIWQNVCYSWNAQTRALKLYYDGKLAKIVDKFSKPVTIGGDGVLILGQDQDDYGGNFEAIDGMIGKITQFNAWNRALNDSEVKAVIERKLFGNLVDWRTALWKLMGGVTVLHPPPVPK